MNIKIREIMDLIMHNDYRNANKKIKELVLIYETLDYGMVLNYCLNYVMSFKEINLSERQLIQGTLNRAMALVNAENLDLKEIYDELMNINKDEEIKSVIIEECLLYKITEAKTLTR